MSSEFSLDLRAARRKAGFTQGDIAHLLSATQSAVSDLERGRRLPTLPEFIALSLIHGRAFESLWSVLMEQARRQVAGQLDTLPGSVRDFVGTFNRSTSLERLQDRLADGAEHGGRA